MTENVINFGVLISIINFKFIKLDRNSSHLTNMFII